MDPTVEKLTRVAALVREWGFTVTTEPGWEDRRGRPGRVCRGTFGVEHWTASPHTTTRELVKGRPGLPVLCNVQLLRDGRLHLIAGLYANHAGDNDDDTPRIAANPPMDADHRPGRDTDFSANGHAIGLEGNAGPGADYTREMHDAAVAWWAACTLVFGWNRDAPPVLGHKEITRRKPEDPSHSMAARRRQIARFIADKTGEGGEEIVVVRGLLDVQPPAEAVFVVTSVELNIRTGPSRDHPTFGSPLPRGTRWFATGTVSGRFVEGRSPFMRAHAQAAQWVHGAFLRPL